MKTLEVVGFSLPFIWFCMGNTEIKKKSHLISNIVRIASEFHDDLKTTPPNYNKEEPAIIQVLLYVSSIDAVNEASMDFTVGLILHLKWLDERIYSITTQNLIRDSDYKSFDFDTENIKKVWVPDIFFPNEKKGSFHDIMTRNQMMKIDKDGSLIYISRLSVTLSCPMDLLNYPFDKQSCNLFIMSFGYSDEDVRFEWYNNSHTDADILSSEAGPIVVDKGVVLPQFEVKEVIPAICNKRYHQKIGNHSCIHAEFHLARNIGFYIVQMYIPSMLIVMLSWISFWLNASSVPGRVSLGVLTVLTMTTQSSSVNASLPKVSYTKAIDVWMSTCLVFVFAALLEFAVVNVLSRRESIRCFSFKNIFAIPTDGDKEEGPPTMCEMRVPLDGFQDAESQKKRRFGKKGIVYAVYVDVAARILFPFCFIMFIIVYWGFYGSQTGI